MKKKIFSLIVILLLAVSVYHYFGEKIYASEVDSEQYIERFFENDDIYDTAHKKYGVYSMGVDQNEKSLHVSMNVSNKDFKEEVLKYFEQQLIINGLNDYNVEIYFYENGYK